MNIPFVDLSRQLNVIRQDLYPALESIYERSNFIGGDAVSEFEKSFGEYLGSGTFIGCANGTDAIELALYGLDVGKGDEVIVPAHTWISTASAVNSVGAIPVFVNSDPSSYNIKVDEIESKITSKTKAIIGVHLYGNPFDVQEVVRIAKENRLFVIEDTAQAHGASIAGKKAGTFADIGTFSFYPSKNLGCFGDGGGLIVQNKDVANRIKAYNNCGQSSKNFHEMPGRNSRLDTIHAEVLLHKLRYLDEWNNLRIEAASVYKEYLNGVEVIIPETVEGNKHVYHIYGIKAKRKKELMATLRKAGVQVGEHYPEILPKMPFYQNNQDFSTSHYVYDLISLPMFPYIRKDEIEYVADIIANFYK